MSGDRWSTRREAEDERVWGAMARRIAAKLHDLTNQHEAQRCVYMEYVSQNLGEAMEDRKFAPAWETLVEDRFRCCSCDTSKDIEPYHISGVRLTLCGPCFSTSPGDPTELQAIALQHRSKK